MGKCSACQSKKCKGKYKNRCLCDNPKNCSCTCLESSHATFWKAFGSIVAGAGIVAGGVTLTVVTGGLGAIVAGGVMIGAGSSFITNPIGKQLSGERMNAVDLAKDVVVGSVIGVASGGLSAGGSVLAKGTTTVCKVAVQVGAGAASGATAGVVSETARAINGEEVSLESYSKAMAIGAACGAAGGASGHVANAVTKDVSSGMARAAVRVTTQAATAIATDKTIQIVENDGDLSRVDIQRTLLTAAASATVATTAECARRAAMRTNAFTSRVNKDLVKGSKSVEGHDIAEEKQRRIQQRIDEMNQGATKKEIVQKLEPENLKKVEEARRNYNEAQKMANKLTNARGHPKPDSAVGHFILRDIEMPEYKRVIDGSMMGPDHLHPLTGEHIGQLAFDLSEVEGRGAGQVIVDAVGQGADRRFLFADFTEKHGYENAAKFGERNYESPQAPRAPTQELVGLQNKRDDVEEEEDQHKTAVTFWETKINIYW